MAFKNGARVGGGKPEPEIREYFLYKVIGDDFMNYWSTSEKYKEGRILARTRREGINNAKIELVGSYECSEKEFNIIKKEFLDGLEFKGWTEEKRKERVARRQQKEEE